MFSFDIQDFVVLLHWFHPDGFELTLQQYTA
jgi:hypothetical protein